MKITAILHSSVIVANTERALEFYCGVLSLKQDTSRPDLGYPGAWLEIGGQQIHLLEVPNPDPVDNRPIHGGRDRHTALGIDDLDELVRRLEAAQISYTLSKSGRHALFCRDFDGNTIELIQTESTQ